MFARLAARVERMSLSRLDDPSRELVAMFNPTTLEESVAASYARLSPPGLPHRILQYTGTDNLSITMRIWMHADSAETLDQVAGGRAFLHSLAYPREVDPRFPAPAPPGVLFLWPGVFALTCRLISLSGEMQSFTESGRLIRYEATITLEEDRDSRLSADDLHFNGTIRAGAVRP